MYTIVYFQILLIVESNDDNRTQAPFSVIIVSILPIISYIYYDVWKLKNKNDFRNIIYMALYYNLYFGK